MHCQNVYPQRKHADCVKCLNNKFFADFVKCKQEKRDVNNKN